MFKFHVNTVDPYIPNKMIDIYYSNELFKKQVEWLRLGLAYEYGKMSFIKINEEFVPFSEQVEQGRLPMLTNDDLILIGTIKEYEQKYLTLDYGQIVERFGHLLV